jgi:hypothetical protein
MSSNTNLLIMDMILLPIIGYFLLKFEPKNILIISVSIFAITILPIWYYVENSSYLYIISIKIWIIIIGIIFNNVINLWHNSLLSKTEKYLIIGIGSSIGSATIGKMTPAICLGLYHYTNSPFTIGCFMFVISLMTILAIIWQYKD